MNFGFSEDQQMIRKSATDFVEGESTLERVRAVIAEDPGYSKVLYQKMADTGWLGAIIPEEYGGIGLGYVDLICITEELGKGMLPEPLISTVLASAALLAGASDEQKNEWLPRVAAGEIFIATGAYELNGRYNLSHVEATATGDGPYTLTGTKSFVEFASSANKILLSARTSGETTDEAGITLFLVDRDAPGLSVTAVSTVDSHPRAMVELKEVQVDASCVIGAAGAGFEIIEAAIDRAIVPLCAEMVGAMEEALRMTIEYAQERVQFGRPIGSFQAVKHKCANMYTAIELTRSSMYYAAMAVDEDRSDARAAVSAAKALASDSFTKVSREAIQIHGGIGFTDEHNIHLFFKRATATHVTYGDPTHHRDRYAKEKGFSHDPSAKQVAEAVTAG